MFFRKKENEPKNIPEDAPQEENRLSILRSRIEEAELPDHALDAARNELEKLEKTDPSVAEYTVGYNYVECIRKLPWSKHSQGNLEIEHARRILDRRHSGLGQVKQRILEFLAAKTLRQEEQQSILIVDDEEIACTNMEHVLGKEGYQCKTARNGLEALEALKQGNIDLIVSDLKMDQMDGLELLAEVNKKYQGVPVILVTGFSTVDSAVKALKNGAAHYLGKPVNLKELKKVVREVLEKKLSSEIGAGPVLCFTGPPGTGKTTVGRAIAEALHLEFIRVSLAGLRDEAELRGHRRTYVGAMPGKIIMELKRAGVNNPVFMLDEIDKIGRDFRGDPSSVMLEILDPEQNGAFMDHYLDIPFNLSQIMFIATANDLSQLPGPLLDRMEIIEFSGYTDQEKVDIADRFIIPRQLKAAGLDREQVTFHPAAVKRIVQDYTRESGLRNLEREVANICRKMALHKLSGERQLFTSGIGPEDIQSLLGPRKFFQSRSANEPKTGITTGLVWSATGGEVIDVETVAMEGNGTLLMTGSLGEVLQESAKTALSYIRSRSKEFNLDDQAFKKVDVHIHFPAGAVSKDGPSAGITIFVALLSLFSGRPARRDVAMTGEMTLSGRILPVSGIKEKLLAAQRSGIVRVFLPAANWDECQALSPDITNGLDVVPIEYGYEIIDKVLLSRRQ